MAPYDDLEYIPRWAPRPFESVLAATGLFFGYGHRIFLVPVMRIFCEQLEPDQWLAWIEGRVETGFTGHTPAMAVERLIETLHGATVDRIAEDHRRMRDGR